MAALPISRTSYQIKLPQFEGPFDLLLFFIERDELDIYNIPIHGLIKDFLVYIHQLEIDQYRAGLGVHPFCEYPHAHQGEDAAAEA